jgi:hypothetical protein
VPLVHSEMESRQRKMRALSGRIVLYSTWCEEKERKDGGRIRTTLVPILFPTKRVVFPIFLEPFTQPFAFNSLTSAFHQNEGSPITLQCVCQVKCWTNWWKRIYSADTMSTLRVKYSLAFYSSMKDVNLYKSMEKIGTNLIYKPLLWQENISLLYRANHKPFNYNILNQWTVSLHETYVPGS